MKNKISIITINYKGIKETKELLYSLQDNLTSKDYEYEVIVVDNASKGNDVVLLKEEFPWVILVESLENLGFSGGNNLGLEKAKGDYVLFINNDTIIKSDIILPLLNRIIVSPLIGVVSPKILDYSTNEILFSGVKPLDKYLLHIHFYTEERSPSRIPYAHGAALFTRRDIINKIGGWPEIFFLYEEELDLCLNISRLGYEIWYEPRAIVYHKGSMTTGKRSSLSDYFSTRNRLLVCKRNLCGFNKYCAIFCLIFFMYPHKCIKMLFAKQYNLILATINGVIDFSIGAFYKGRVYKKIL